MENKKNLYIGIAIVAIVAVSGIAAVFLLMPPGETTPPPGDTSIWPTAAVPSANLSVSDELSGEEKNITLQEIVDLLKADTSKIRQVVWPIKDGAVWVNHNFIGFNPLDIFEELGYWDPGSIKLVGGDGFTSSINALDLFLRDDEFSGQWLLKPVFVGIVCDKQWLNHSSIQGVDGKWYGHFSVFGNTTSSGQRMKNLVAMNITTHWSLAVKVNDVTEFSINRDNITVNEYTAQYSYYDNASNKGWNNTFTGRTLADIVNRTSAATQDYVVNFTTADGFGMGIQYTESEIQSGLAGKPIGNPAAPMDTDGLLCTLYYKIAPNAGTPDYNLLTDGGPFRLVVPGQTRDRYLKWMTEITIYTV